MTTPAQDYGFAQGSGYVLPEYEFVPPPELRTGRAGRYPVLICGGGLAGLTLACSLARFGVAAVLLDEDNTIGVKGASSRGICYTQRSLEIFDRLGIYGRIAAKGVQWSVGRTYAGNDEVYSFDLREQSAYNLSCQPPFTNIQQFYVEAFLVDRIRDLGHVDLRWCSRVVGFEQDDEIATLRVSTPQGDYTLQAGHVIDATGSHTPFRRWVGASVTAKKGDDRWCIADVRFQSKGPAAAERRTWIEAPFNENRAVWQHPMADGVWRIDYQMAPNADPEQVSREEVVRERLARHFGADAQFEMVWVGPYAYKSECVDQMRHGRVFFVGDAAKVVSPFGARGGNTGIADAENLAWKLAAVLRGHAAPSLLDSYHDERHEAARQNVLVTNRTARFLRPANAIDKLFRDAAIALARRYTFARQFVNTGRMAIANPYANSRACCDGGGLPVQNVSFRWADGTRGTVRDLLDWASGRLLLLLFGQVDAASIRRVRALTQSAPLLAVQVLGSGGKPRVREHVRDAGDHLRGGCHVFGHTWALVRPDAYVAATGEAVDASVIDAVARCLGAAEAAIVRPSDTGQK